MKGNLIGNARIKGQRMGIQQIGDAHDRSSACAIVSKAYFTLSIWGANQKLGETSGNSFKGEFGVKFVAQKTVNSGHNETCVTFGSNNDQEGGQ